jgi:hypothetical protein
MDPVPQDRRHGMVVPGVLLHFDNQTSVPCSFAMGLGW